MRKILSIISLGAGVLGLLGFVDLNAIDRCATYKPWISKGKVLFVENTCKIR